MPIPLRQARLGALLLLTTAVAPAGAAPFTAEFVGTAGSSASASADQNNAPFGRVGDYPDDQYVSVPMSNLPVSGSATLGANAGGGSSFASSSFMATAGGLHVSAVASASGSPPTGWNASGYSSSFADAVAYDSFIVSAPGLAADAVFTITASLYMTGSVGAMGFSPPSGGYDALATWQAEVSFENSTMMYVLQERASSSFWDSPSTGAGYGGDGFSTLNLTFTVANGQPTRITIAGHVRARAMAGAGSDAVAGADAWSDLGHTIGWGGISSVLDDAGNPLDTFTALSETSGFDYRNAYAEVPEPSSLALIMVGMFRVLGRRKSDSR